MRRADWTDWQPAHALAPGLHLVATPIGNLGDITLRALWVLRGVDRILCEDTRVTARLLAHFGIDKPLDAYHDHNADRVRPAVLEALRRGETLALVSDAGTPLVSDPGFKLVRAALAEDLPVTAAPGPSAALTALILSGLPPDRFLFAGFLPPRAAARRRTLTQWAALEATLIFFEGPSRLAAALADMAEILGARDAADRPRTDQAPRGNPPRLRSTRWPGTIAKPARRAAKRSSSWGRPRRLRSRPTQTSNSGCGRCSPGTLCATRWRCSPRKPASRAARFTNARSR